LPIASGGTGSTTNSGARTNLGLGTIATQNSNAVSITGGTITGITDLTVADGGTGRSTLTANNVLLGNGTSAVNFVAPGTSGNVLTSNGTTWTSGTAFVTGMIMLWSGSVASIPSGWALCNGSNGTPDLRNRFVVGAGSTYAVNATGGSANAIVVSHTHTATSTSTVTDPGHGHRLGSNDWASSNCDGLNTSNSIAGRNFGFGAYYTAGPGGVPFVEAAATGVTVATTTTVASAGSSGTNANLPPYYALAYIMKL
jgi:hypothetical protein